MYLTFLIGIWGAGEEKEGMGRSRGGGEDERRGWGEERRKENKIWNNGERVEKEDYIK